MLTRIILAILVALALTSSIVSAAPAASQAPLEASGDLVERIVTQHSLNIAKRAASYPEPIQGPALRDPTIINLGASYLLCGTGTKMPCYSAPQLTGPWSPSGSILKGPSIIGKPGSDAPWAPSLHRVNGAVHCYYSVSQFSTQNSAIGLAVSSSGQPGTYTDQGELFATKPGEASNAIDPWLTPDGSHLSYGSFWQGIFLTSASHPTLPGTNIAGGFPGGDAIEASNIFQKGGSFYLFASKGRCCGWNAGSLVPYGTSEYMIVVGKSNSLAGPYVDASGKSMLQGGGTVVLSSFGNKFAPGGQSVYADPKSGRDILVFHYLVPESPQDDKAKIGIYYLDWAGGWPKVVNH